MPNSKLDVLAVDTAISGDDALPGIAQPITASEIKDILYSNAPRAERLDKLKSIERDLRSRHSADTQAGFGPLVSETERAIALLQKDAQGQAAPSVLSAIDQDASTTT